MNKYKTFEELKEELEDKFEDYMYKANIELLTKIDKAENEIERLNNIINELENELSNLYDYYYNGIPKALCKHLLDMVEELKGDKMNNDEREAELQNALIGQDKEE